MSKVIGIDVSKASFDVSFKEKGELFHYFKFENNLKGFKKLSKVLTNQDHCIMEATGPYYLSLAKFLFENGNKVSVVNPLQIKHFVRMRMVRSKTDKKDAKMIALYGETETPKLWEPNQKHVEMLQQNHTAIEGLQKQSTMLKNQIEALSQNPYLDNQVIKELKSLLQTLSRKIIKLENRMLEIVKQHYGETYEALNTIPGIGPKTAIFLIALTNNFNKFEDSKSFSSYVGLAPRIYQSGTSVNGRGHITKMGNRHLRKLLYLCSWTAKKWNKQCAQMYERLSEKGKPEKVIKIAIANKLLRQAFAVGTTLKSYDKNYQEKFAF
jgi:transposase